MVSNIFGSLIFSFLLRRAPKSVELGANRQYTLDEVRIDFNSVPSQVQWTLHTSLIIWSTYSSFPGRIMCRRLFILSVMNLHFPVLNVRPALGKSGITVLTCDICSSTIRKNIIISSRYNGQPATWPWLVLLPCFDRTCWAHCTLQKENLQTSTAHDAKYGLFCCNMRRQSLPVKTPY